MSCRTVCIKVTPRVKRDPRLQSVERMLEQKAMRSFAKAGIRAVSCNEDNDLSLEIKGRWQAHGCYYDKGPVPSRLKSYQELRKHDYFYTGATVVGSIYLKLDNRVVIAKYFNGRIPTASRVIGGSTKPYGAPFARAMAKPGSFEPKLAELMAKAFGERWPGSQ